MKRLKKRYWFLALLIILMGSSCIYAKSRKLPVFDYPLSKERIAQAILNCDLPEDLTIQENDIAPPSGWEGTSYTLRSQEKEDCVGYGIGILSNKKGDVRGLGINVSEMAGEDELKQIVVFATYLFGGFKNEKRVYNSLKKQVDTSNDFTWKEEIDGIACRVQYKTDLKILVISFSSDWDSFFFNQENS